MFDNESDDLFLVISLYQDFVVGELILCGILCWAIAIYICNSYSRNEPKQNKKILLSFAEFLFATVEAPSFQIPMAGNWNNLMKCKLIGIYIFQNHTLYT